MTTYALKIWTYRHKNYIVSDSRLVNLSSDNLSSLPVTAAKQRPSFSPKCRLCLRPSLGLAQVQGKIHFCECVDWKETWQGCDVETVPAAMPPEMLHWDILKEEAAFDPAINFQSLCHFDNKLLLRRISIFIFLLHIWIHTHDVKTYLFCLVNSNWFASSTRLSLFLIMSSHPPRIPIFHCKTLFFTVNYGRPMFPLTLLLQIRKQLHIPLTAWLPPVTRACSSII